MKIKNQTAVQPLSAQNMIQTSGGWGWVPYAVGTGIVIDFLRGFHDGLTGGCHDECGQQP